jgi:hypothetical protein
MFLLALAGVHALIYQAVTRGQGAAGENSTSPVGVKIAGAISLLLWIGVVAAGRWIGFI